MIHFPVVQECEQGVHRRIEIPAPGENADDNEEPAPGVTLTAASAALPPAAMARCAYIPS